MSDQSSNDEIHRKKDRAIEHGQEKTSYSQLPSTELLSDENVPRRSNWQLVRLRFQSHNMAMVSLVVITIIWIVSVFFAEFFAPYTVTTYSKDNVTSPPQTPRFIDENGTFNLRPFVYGYDSVVDQKTTKRTFTINIEKKYPLFFGVQGESYKLWGLIETDIHCFGTKEGYAYILGGDRLGRDILSRIIYGGRVSLTIGVIGVIFSMIIGTTAGIISGYFGGSIDMIIQRGIEIMMSFPPIPLWMALTAALPANWTSIQVYFAITTLLGLLSWGSLARLVRGQTLALRDLDFIKAAQSIGASQIRIIFKHLLPNVVNQVIVIATLTIPWVILSETSLSFLGLGIRPPMTSWGVLLEEAQNVQAIKYHPWSVIPAFFVIITVLTYNFIGDGLRDAFEPRS